jgi:hypothetical protein
MSKHENSTRHVSLSERQEILDKIHSAFVLGNYPTSANDKIMKDLHRLIRDTEERICEKHLKEMGHRSI